MRAEWRAAWREVVGAIEAWGREDFTKFTRYGVDEFFDAKSMTMVEAVDLLESAAESLNGMPMIPIALHA